MKTLKLKAVVVSWMATIIAIGGISGFAFGQTTASSAKSYSGFKQEKAAINKDLVAINKQQDKVKSLKEQCRAENRSGVKSSTAHSDLIRAKADLKRQKAYLTADKKELVAKHDAIVEYRKATVRDERAELKVLHKQLDADLAAGKSSAVLQAQQIVTLKQNLHLHELALENAYKNREYDVAVINKEIRDWNGQYDSLLVPGNDVTRNESVAMK